MHFSVSSLIIVGFRIYNVILLVSSVRVIRLIRLILLVILILENSVFFLTLAVQAGGELLFSHDLDLINDTNQVCIIIQTCSR
jgi:hypothetical protein